MKKYVVCRIVDTAPKPMPQEGKPPYSALQKMPAAQTKPVFNTQPDNAEPAPHISALRSFIDRAYDARHQVPESVGCLLNIAV